MITKVQNRQFYFKGYKEISTTTNVAATTEDKENLQFLNKISDLVNNPNSKINVKNYNENGFSLYSVVDDKFKTINIDYEIERKPRFSREVLVRYKDRLAKGYNNSSVCYSEDYTLGIDHSDKRIKSQVVDFLKSLLNKTDIWPEVEKKYLAVWKLK